jgi:hypothetical protein
MKTAKIISSTKIISTKSIAENMEIYLGLYVLYILCAAWVNNKYMEVLPHPPSVDSNLKIYGPIIINFCIKCHYKKLLA